MIGQCVASSCGSSQSDYATITGRSHLPNTAGRFLRDSGGSASSLANNQGDATKLLINGATSSTHSPEGNSVSALIAHYPGVNMSAIETDTTWSGAYPNKRSLRNAMDSNYGGSVETRPVNTTVNYFVKINHNCN
jgi:hypothetical protein